MVIGAGEAGINFIKKLKGNSHFRISLIDRRYYYFNKRDFITSFSLRDWVDLREFSQKEGYTFIQDTIEGINISRKKLYLKNNEPKDFDILVVAVGLKSKDIDIRGEHREGFFYLSDIEPFEIKKLLKVSSEIVVYVSTLLGIKLSVALAQLAKEVKIVFNNLDFFGENKEKAIDFLKTKNIAFYPEVAIDEAIGEGQVKATRLSPLKIISSQLVFIDSGFLPNRDFFVEGLAIRDNFSTEYEDIYCIGDAGYIKEELDKEFFFMYNNEEAKAQGEFLATYLLGGSYPHFQRKAITYEDKQRLIDDILIAKKSNAFFCKEG